MKSEKVVFGSGCFWCSEAIFKNIIGVLKVTPGYAGGDTDNPIYERVCTGETGHAEVIEIEYDPDQINFSDLLTIFFSTHNPTTKNRQGADVGSQYRSIILYTTPDQKIQAEKMIDRLDKDRLFPDPIVTEVRPLEQFYPAEISHQRYYELHQGAPYCQTVIEPKLVKLKIKYQHLIKK